MGKVGHALNPGSIGKEQKPERHFLNHPGGFTQTPPLSPLSHPVGKSRERHFCRKTEISGVCWDNLIRLGDGDANATGTRWKAIGNVRQKVRRRLNITRCHFPLVYCSLQELLPKQWISSSVLLPCWGVGWGLILLPVIPLRTQSSTPVLPAADLPAALGWQCVLGRSAIVRTLSHAGSKARL